MKKVALPNGRVWLRVAAPEWRDPLAGAYAAERGGRWNPPSSYEVVYLSGDVPTAKLQIERMVAGTPLRIDDLADDAYVLIAATLPRDQVCADIVSDAGVAAAGLPATYPCDAAGEPDAHAITQAAGLEAHDAGLRGLWCRSACTSDGRGRELAWFPATRRSRARAVWVAALPLGEWRDAESWEDLGLQDQPVP